MMNYDHAGWAWMGLMPLLWIALIALIVWAVVKLTQGPGKAPRGTESAGEILDRRYAHGEIDSDTYRQMREHLSGRKAGS